MQLDIGPDTKPELVNNLNTNFIYENSAHLILA